MARFKLIFSIALFIGCLHLVRHYVKIKLQNNVETNYEEDIFDEIIPSAKMRGKHENCRNNH